MANAGDHEGMKRGQVHISEFYHTVANSLTVAPREVAESCIVEIMGLANVPLH